MNHKFELGTEVTTLEPMTNQRHIYCKSSEASYICALSDLELVKQYSEDSILERLWSKEKLFSAKESVAKLTELDEEDDLPF